VPLRTARRSGRRTDPASEGVTFTNRTSSQTNGVFLDDVDRSSYTVPLDQACDPNKVYLCVTCPRQSPTVHTVPTLTTTGGTWHLLGHGNGFDTFTAFAGMMASAFVGKGFTGSQVVIDLAGQTQEVCHAVVLELDGVETGNGGLDAINNAVFYSNWLGGTSTTYTVWLSKFTDPNNAVVHCNMSGVTNAQHSADTANGFVGVSRGSGVSQSMGVQWKTSEFVSPTMTQITTSSILGLAFEIRKLGAPAPVWRWWDPDNLTTFSRYLDHGKDNVSLSSYTTVNSITPTANEPVVVAVGTIAAATNRKVTAVSGCGLTWAEVPAGTVFYSGNLCSTSLWIGVGASPTAGQLTFTCTSAMTGCGWAIGRLPGLSATPVQSKTASHEDAPSISVTLNTTVGTGNVILAAMGQDSGQVPGPMPVTGNGTQWTAISSGSELGSADIPVGLFAAHAGVQSPAAGATGATEEVGIVAAEFEAA
jgi:hypothetical protein